MGEENSVEMERGRYAARVMVLEAALQHISRILRSASMLGPINTERLIGEALSRAGFGVEDPTP